MHKLFNYVNETGAMAVIGEIKAPLLLLQSNQFKQITVRFEIHQEIQVRSLDSGVLSHSRFFNLLK